MQLTKVKAALGLGTAILAFAGAVASATVWFAKKLSDMDARIEKLDRAIKALNVNTTDERYRELVKELLAEQASPSKDFEPPKGKFPAKLQMPAKHAMPYADGGVSASSPAAKPPN